MRELRDAFGHTCGSVGNDAAGRVGDLDRSQHVIRSRLVFDPEANCRFMRRPKESCFSPLRPVLFRIVSGFAAAILHDRDCRRSGQTRKRTCRHRQEQLRDCAGADIAGNQCRRRADFRETDACIGDSAIVGDRLSLLRRAHIQQSDGCGAQGQRSAYLAKARARPARDRGTKPDQAQASLVERALS